MTAASRAAAAPPGADAHRLPFIDGLRGIAVLSVVVYHLVPTWVPGGFVGVDIFFVISGFVVAAAADRLPSRGALAFAGEFFARRVRRILPALLVCLGLTGLLAMLYIPPSWLSEQVPRTGMLAFVGLSNIVLAYGGDGYFAPRSEFNPYAHTWSLGVEEQFYLVFPLWFLAWRLGGRGRRVALVLTAAVLVLSLLAAAGSGGEDAARAFYLPTTRFWQLASGVLLFQGLASDAVRSVLRERFRPARTLLCAVGLMLIVVGVMLARPGHTPWPDSLPAVLGTLMLLALLGGDARAGWVSAVLEFRPLLGLGLISYSLYLWHWPVIVLLRWTVGVQDVLHIGVALLVSVLLAAASYRWVEQPIRRGVRLSRWPNARVVALGIVLALGGGWAFHLLHKQQVDWSLSTAAREADDWMPDRPGPDPIGAHCAVNRHTASAQGFPVRVLRAEGCAAARDATRVFVIGDSHAIGHFALLHALAASAGHEVRILFRAGCPFPPLGVDAPGDSPACAALAAAAWSDVVAHARAGDVLLLPSLHLPRLSELQGGSAARPSRPRPAPDPASAAALERAAIARLTPFAARGLQIVFEAPKPVLPAPAFRCVDGFNRANPACVGGLSRPRVEVEDERAGVLASMRRIGSSLPQVSVWDPLPLLCPGAECTALRAGRPIFFDGDHLSGYGSRQLLPSLQRHLDALAADRGRDASAPPP